MTGRLRRCLALAVLVLAPLSADALDLEVPVGAELTAERISSFDTFQAPSGNFDGGTVPKIDIEGEVVRRAWRITGRDLTPLQLIAPLREQLEAQGFDIVFECAASDCGGFDFRFNIEVLPGPNMFVDISRFRYLAGLRGDPSDPTAAIGVLTSVTAGAAYLQIIEANVEEAPALAVAVPAEKAGGPFFEQPAPVAASEDLAAKLLTSGRVILDDLEFETGTTTLGTGSYPSLSALAQFLNDRPDLRIALVGHTDTVGGLDPNIALSRARAESVRSRLIEEHGMAARRIDAEGMGYLAPVASNLTEEGRTRNRRVEAILLTD